MRLQQIAATNGAIAIPTPTKAMITSFTSYQKLILRGGIAVGGQSLQDIVDFGTRFALNPEMGDDVAFCPECFVDSQRGDPFFVLLLTTKRLISSFDSTRPIETDETYKVMHEGYPLTLIGQSDMNRTWHLRSVKSFNLNYHIVCSRLTMNFFQGYRSIYKLHRRSWENLPGGNPTTSPAISPNSLPW